MKKKIMSIVLSVVFICSAINMTYSLWSIDNWLDFTLDNKSVYAEKTELTGRFFSPNENTVMKVKVGEKILAETIIGDTDKVFSITVDFSQCDVGDDIIVSREYLGEHIVKSVVNDEEVAFATHNTMRQLDIVAKPIDMLKITSPKKVTRKTKTLKGKTDCSINLQLKYKKRLLRRLSLIQKGFFLLRN